MVRKRFLVGLLLAIVSANVAYWIQQNDLLKEDIFNGSSYSRPEIEQLNSEDFTTKKLIPKYDLYSQTPYDLPLISIFEISKQSSIVKKSIDKVLELSQGFYYLKQIEDKVFIVLQNPAYEGDTYYRHGLQVAEIDSSGKILYHTVGYSGIEGEILAPEKTDSDFWVYDKTSEPYKPLKHVAYNEKGKIKFSEFWDYSPESNVKYEMKDSANKTISVLKEILEDDTNYRKEHIFYDNEGKILISISINFEGANITRFNYFNAKKPNSSVIIICDYVDGQKAFEKIYDKDYNLINIVEAVYRNGERKEVKVFDSEKKELGKISS